MQMQRDYYPGLYYGADAAAASAQRTYLLLQRAHLGSLIAAAVVAIFISLSSGASVLWTYTAMAILLAVGLLVFWVGRSRQYDKVWFDCRAIAESIKSMTWRFMMRTPPFHDASSSDQGFVLQMREIREARPDCQKHLAGVAAASGAVITDFMRQVRDLPFDQRKSLYIQERLRDQRSWYSSNAELNARTGDRWFWATAGLQGSAIAAAIIQAVAGGIGFNIVPVFTTWAAAFAAWNQIKRHDELTKTYSVPAQELAELEAIASSLTAESDFPQLVEQVEEAISREHTMWCARRDVMLPRTITKAL